HQDMGDAELVDLGEEASWIARSRHEIDDIFVALAGGEARYVEMVDELPLGQEHAIAWREIRVEPGHRRVAGDVADEEGLARLAGREVAHVVEIEDRHHAALHEKREEDRPV